jgi:adenylate kinase family enzyme
MRVSVIGTSCSGKTTFARELALRKGIAHVELDSLYWLPGWEVRPEEEFRHLVDQEVEKEAWVIDGNYRKVRDLVWARATHIVWLNYPFWLVLQRALTRTLRRIITHEVLFSGNQENWGNAFFGRDSILWWVITTHRRRKKAYRSLFNQPLPGLEMVEIRTPKQARQFIEQGDVSGYPRV